LVSSGPLKIADVAIALEEQYILREEATWKNPEIKPESFALQQTSGRKRDWMSVQGLLPQHIRNLISKYHLPQLHKTFIDNVVPPVSEDIDAIAALLTSYQDALNASSIDKVVALYAPSGVFMPQHFSASIGPEAISRVYHGIFSSMTLQVRFSIEEIVPTNANWAFARTTSDGTIIKKSGVASAEANHELYVLQKIGGFWKIARFCFCTTDSLQ